MWGLSISNYRVINWVKTVKAKIKNKFNQANTVLSTSDKELVTV